MKLFRMSIVICVALFILASISLAQDAEIQMPVQKTWKITGTWNRLGSTGPVQINIQTQCSWCEFVKIQVLGDCSPTPCDWGWVYATPFSSSVGSDLAEGFVAVYNDFFKKTTIVGYRHYMRLRVTFCTEYKDGSGRYSYVKTYDFMK